jgi:hypothetical protein
VPAIAGAGLIIELAAPAPLIGPLTPGMIGCVAASLVLFVLAVRATRKDIVSLCIPLIALYMFVIFPENVLGIFWQALFALSLSVLAVRFGLWFQ